VRVTELVLIGVQVSEAFSAEDQPRAVCVGLFLVMVGGCISAVACDSHPWFPVMLLGLVRSALPLRRYTKH